MSGKTFTVTGEEIMECNCDFSCSYGLTCRHVMAVHSDMGQKNINQQECLARYSRLSKKSELLYLGAATNIQQFEAD